MPRNLHDLAPALAVYRHRNYGGNRDNAAAFALTQIGVASSHRYGQLPVNGRSKKAFTRSSMSLHSLETVLFEIPLSPMA